ncbi:hypothetical protein [Teredinibacter haidensis]|uniref:hypothetical protein n=1 Tax=Teredinibacter haidensis TaxID=2731755 RepID=UPI000948D6F5|nr:hypothetical protein [Teredinibacter haidensis]
MSNEAFPEEAIEAKKTQFIESAKQSLLEKIRPIIEYHVRSSVAPHTINTEQELNQYYVDEAVSEHEASGKPKHPYKSFSDFAKEQRGE